jgi:hypothetical protein
VYLHAATELIELMGEGIYQRLVAELASRRSATPVTLSV